MESNVPKAFKIIVQHFSGQTLCQSQQEIYESVMEHVDQDEPHPVIPDDVRRTLRYSKDFGLVKKPRPQRCWHIKSVDDMCDWLHVVHNGNIENDDQDFTVSIAFKIIIHIFSDDTDSRSTREIEEHVFNVHQNQGGLPKYAVKDPVGWTLRFLNHFGFAKKTGRSDYENWHIKSVDKMCQRLHALVRNRNIGDEGEDF